MEVSKPYKIGKYWTNLIDSRDGKSVNYEEVTTWLDGSPMDDSKCDGFFFRKLGAEYGGGYVKLVQDYVLVKPKPDDPTYNRTKIQEAIDFLEGGFDKSAQLRRSGGTLKIGEGRCPIDRPIITRRRGLVIEGASRGTVIFAAPDFPTNRALIQSRNFADREGDASGPFTSCTVRNMTLSGVDPDTGDFGVPNQVIGAWFSRMDAQGAPFGFENVKFRSLMEGIRGTRLYGMHVRDCSFEGGTNSSHWGIALNFDQDSQGGEADDPGGVRAFYCDNTQFIYLSQVVRSRYGYGYGFSAIRVENCTPLESITDTQRAVFLLRDAKQWSIGGGSYFENANTNVFILGGATAGGTDDCRAINIQDCSFYNSSGTVFNIRGLHSSTIVDNYYSPSPGTRRDFLLISGTDNISENIIERGNGTVTGNMPVNNSFINRTDRVIAQNPITTISNSDGDCIRYPNGWQLCVRTVSLDLTTTTPQQFQWAANFISPQSGIHIIKSFSIIGTSSQRTEYNKTSGVLFGAGDFWNLVIADTGGATGTINVQLRAEGFYL